MRGKLASHQLRVPFLWTCEFTDNSNLLHIFVIILTKSLLSCIKTFLAGLLSKTNFFEMDYFLERENKDPKLLTEP